MMERFVRFMIPVTVIPFSLSLVLNGLGLSLASVPREYTALVMVTLFTGFRLWLKLHDSDLAYADRGARSFRRRTRNRLRRLLGIHDV